MEKSRSDNHDDQPAATPVLIAGGGPVGLVLALELEQRGIHAILVERNTTTTLHPKMDITNGRSMEHFRRLGIAEHLRSHAVPSDHPMSVVWCTRLAEWELARFDYPSVDSGRAIVDAANDGTLALEPDMRISQVVLEPVLRDILETPESHIDVRFGWKLESFEQDAHGVTSVIRSSETGETQHIRSEYLAGCDGAGSVTRNGLGIELDLMARTGPVYMIHFRSGDRRFFERFGTAWHLQSPIGGTIISQNDLDTWTLHGPMPKGVNESEIDPQAYLFEQLGAQVDCEILVANSWHPTLAVAESYGRGRVWLAGDSAHQVIPTGGYGMNTGVGDAADLAWKLEATLNGWGGPELLRSYDQERRPVGFRARAASARHFDIRRQIFASYTPELHEDSETGARARRDLGSLIEELGNLENEAHGLVLGYRYDDSPIVCHEAGEPPREDLAAYVPSTWPGVRVPSVNLEDGTAIFDRLGPGFTLLSFSDVDSTPIEAAAAQRGLPLHVLDIQDEKAQGLYECALVLVRPDQHVAWRGNAAPGDPLGIIDRIRGSGINHA